MSLGGKENARPMPGLSAESESVAGMILDQPAGSQSPFPSYGPGISGQL